MIGIDDDGITLNNDSKFDIQLAAARLHERELAALMTREDLKLEVKTETWQWRRTGNICIEYFNRGKPSGIATTEADIWVHELCDDDGVIITRLFFEVPKLKELCRAAYKRGQYRENVGDDHQSNVILLPTNISRWTT